jgi:tRNA (Thr-GGU) A37 N-methylase
MNTSFKVNSIGHIKYVDDKIIIELNKKYLAGLRKIEGFSHLQIIWWAHLTDKPQHREKLIAENLFKKAPSNIGIFSTRSPARPNPLMISTIKVIGMDTEEGIIYTAYIDAEPNTPVLDIKPYFPMERVKNCAVPQWFEQWPNWAEDAMSFNWQEEINFG